MQRDYYLCIKAFGSTQDVRRRHLVLYTNRILTKSKKSHVNIKTFTLFSKSNREVRVSTMIYAPRWGGDKVTNRTLIHRRHLIIRWHRLSGTVSDKDCPIKRLNRFNSHVTNRKNITGNHNHTATFRYTPRDPLINNILWAYKRYVLLNSLKHCSSNVFVQMIVMDVCDEKSIQITDSKRIKDYWRKPQIRLWNPCSGNTSKLMPWTHRRKIVRTLTCSAP